MSYPVKRFFLIGECIDRNYQNKFYGKAQNLGRKLSAAYDAVFKDFDVLVMPTLGDKAMPLPTVENTLEGNASYAMVIIISYYIILSGHNEFKLKSIV